MVAQSSDASVNVGILHPLLLSCQQAVSALAFESGVWGCPNKKNADADHVEDQADDVEALIQNEVSLPRGE